MWLLNLIFVLTAIGFSITYSLEKNENIKGVWLICALFFFIASTAIPIFQSTVTCSSALNETGQCPLANITQSTVTLEENQPFISLWIPIVIMIMWTFIKEAGKEAINSIKNR